MNYCMCQNPKKTKNSANGVDFFVCAKSKGGCGLECGGTSNKSASKFPMTIETVEGACLRALAAHVGLDMGGQDQTVTHQINPHIKSKKTSAIWCTCCGGTGIIRTTLHNGLAKEDSCAYCEGVGEIIL